MLALLGVAFDLHVGALQPVEEALQGRRMNALVGESHLQELGDRIIRLAAEAAQQLAAAGLGWIAVRRGAEHPHEELERRDLIGEGKHLGKVAVGARILGHPSPPAPARPATGCLRGRTPD